MELISRYFPEIDAAQSAQFAALEALYQEWNPKINVISRKDIENLYLHHVLHSLAIAKFIRFLPSTKVLDIGTGGGFPGIPLAVLFPETQFFLVDSVAKKLKVVEAVVAELGLKNVKFAHIRVEQVKQKFDFAVSRAVAPASTLQQWVLPLLKDAGSGEHWNGMIMLKGGDLKEELAAIRGQYTLKSLSAYFTEPYFETKKLVYIPVQ